MMTQTHMLLAAAVFTRPGKPLRNSAALLGGILPDLALYTLLVSGLASGVTMQTMFRQLYWSPSWQAAMSPGNSAPVFLLVLAVGYGVWRGDERRREWGAALMALAGAALLHVALDFPLHVNDGHTHLWPFSDWKFVSPVSYWDSNYHANWVRPVEFLLGLTCLAILFRRFKALWVRALVLAGMAAYILEPLFFLISFAD